MKRALRRIDPSKRCWHFVKDEKIYGLPSGLRGDVSGLSGDVSGLRGDVSGLWGDVTECELSEAERDAGVNVVDLIASETEMAS